MRQKSPRFHSEAAEEAQAAFRMVPARNPMAAAAFLDELDHAVEQVSEAPQRWLRYGHAARRYVFPRFPFSLIYRVTDERIEIVAVAHGKRRPGYWQSR